MRILQKEEHIPNHVLSASRKHFSGACLTHGHSFFELEYILDGQGTYVIDGVEHTVQGGTVILLSPTNVHAVKDSDMELFNVMFTCDPGDLMLPLASGATVHHPSKQAHAFLVALLTELTEAEDRRYALTLLRCILQKLALTVSCTKPAPSPYVHRAIGFIMNRFADGITLEQTARYLGLSTAYFSDLFQKQTGKGFKAYLDDVRFSYAEHMLMLTDLPIGQVLAAAGFADYANFARRFKARYGLSPTAYRTQKVEKKQKI